MLRSRLILQSRKAVMVKGYKIQDVASHCSAHDCVFARKLPKGGCQFFAWPGVSHDEAANAILAMPPHLQTVHALFGRVDIPMDLCADIDCPVPSTLNTVAQVTDFQSKTVRDTIAVLHDIVKQEGHEVDSQVCLQSPNMKKASFHVHLRLKGAAFADFRSVLGFLQPHKDKIPYVDLQIFRYNGMLRMHKSKKENLQSQMTLYNPCTISSVPMTDLLAAKYSLCVREAKSYQNLITRVPQHTMSVGTLGGAKGTGNDAAGEQTLAPRTKVEALENAKRWALGCSEEDVATWKSWVGIGFALHRVATQYHDVTVPSFQRPPMEELLNVWIEISKKCPAKFVVGDCEKSWSSFKDEDADGWWISYKMLHRRYQKAQQQL